MQAVLRFSILSPATATAEFSMVGAGVIVLDGLGERLPLLLMLSLMSRALDEVRLQEDTERGIGLIHRLLTGKGINQNRFSTEVMLKTGGYGGEKVRGGDGSGGIMGKLSLLISTRPHMMKI